MTMTILIEHDFDRDSYMLLCASHGLPPMPAGPRLFRAQPHPRIKFEHETLADAEKDAQVLRDYISSLPAKKESKMTLRDNAAALA
jgi:hypothetical protein